MNTGNVERENGGKKKEMGRRKDEREKLEVYMKMARGSGCEREQMENFLKAGIWLQKKQLEFVGKCRECDEEGGPTAVMFAGGRGSSKTHAVWAQVFADDCQRMAGLKVLILRKVGKANQEQINDYRQKLLGNLKHDYKQQAQEIIFENGSKVILGNFKDEKDIDKYLGLEYDLIAISESNQLTFTKKKFILTCLRTSKAGWRPRLYEDTNPGGVGMAENKSMYVIPFRRGVEHETGTRYVHSTVYDNQFVNKEYVTLLESLTGWQRKAWLEGDWDFAAGSFFTNFIPDYHVYPNPTKNFDEHDAVRWYAGYDWGIAHCSAVVLIAEDKKGVKYIVDEWSDNGMVMAQQADIIHNLLADHGISVSTLDYFSAGRDCFARDKDGKTVAQDFEALGISLTPGDVDRQNGWKVFHSLFGDIAANVAPRLYVNSKCTGLITQIQLAQHNDRRPGDVQKFNATLDGEGGDDLLDATKTCLASDPYHAIQFAKPVSICRSPYQLVGLGI